MTGDRGGRVSEAGSRYDAIRGQMGGDDGGSGIHQKTETVPYRTCEGGRVSGIKEGVPDIPWRGRGVPLTCGLLIDVPRNGVALAAALVAVGPPPPAAPPPALPPSLPPNSQPSQLDGCGCFRGGGGAAAAAPPVEAAPETVPPPPLKKAVPPPLVAASSNRSPRDWAPATSISPADCEGGASGQAH